MATPSRASRAAALLPSTEASRRAFVLRNYASLRNRIDALEDQLVGQYPPPPMGRPGRWSQRVEYLEECARAGGPDPATAALWPAVLTAEFELSAICVKYIHAPAEQTDTPRAKQYLFSYFAGCEAAWASAAGAREEGVVAPMGAGRPENAS